MVDIFKEAKEAVVPTWAKFSEDGDSAQGTYVGKIEGQIDGYGNKQVIYQILQDDNSVVNVGFGVNKKFIIGQMETVNFGQIIGFVYKGKVKFKDKFGKTLEVKDFGLHQQANIVNDEWLKENKDNMPEVVRVSDEPLDEIAQSKIDANKTFNSIQDTEEAPFPKTEDKPELTESDKLGVIEKLAKDKLDSNDVETTKAKVMEKTGIAFIPLNYDSIIAELTKI